MHSERVRVTIRYTMNNRINRYILSHIPLSRVRSVVDTLAE